MNTIRGWIVRTCFLLLATSVTFAQSAESTGSPVVPRLVKFSGSLRDEAGHAKPGIAGVTFALYKDQTGGAPLWLETQNVTGDSRGNYTVLLGSTKPQGLPADLVTSNEAQWLSVQVEGQAEQARSLSCRLSIARPVRNRNNDHGTVGRGFCSAAPHS